MRRLWTDRYFSNVTNPVSQSDTSATPVTRGELAVQRSNAIIQEQAQEEPQSRSSSVIVDERDIEEDGEVNESETKRSSEPFGEQMFSRFLGNRTRTFVIPCSRTMRLTAPTERKRIHRRRAWVMRNFDLPGSTISVHRSPSSAAIPNLETARHSIASTIGGPVEQLQTPPRVLPVLGMNTQYNHSMTMASAASALEDLTQQPSQETEVPRRRGVTMRNVVRAVIKENSVLEDRIKRLEDCLRERDDQIVMLKRTIQRIEAKLESKNNQLKTMRIITKVAPRSALVGATTSGTSSATQDVFVSKKNMRTIAGLAMFESFRLQAGKYKRHQQRMRMQRRRHR